MRRNTRNYKEKKPMITFGQFILPLTVVMAVALLFFSVKLFFLSPDQLPFDDEKETPKKETVISADIKPDAPQVKKTEPKPLQPAEPAKPAEPKKKTEPVKQPQTQAEPKKVKEITAKKTRTEKPASFEPAKKTEPAVPAKAALPRWDVQIGGFASLDSAKALLKKAGSEGFETYMAESKREGAPFYKVRVRGAQLKEDAAKKAAKLEAAGYPVYLVEIKK